MKKLNEFCKRFISYFIFCLCLGFGFAFVEWAVGKIQEWWFWMPAKLGSAFLEWVQDHPPLMAILICFVFACIATVLSYIFHEEAKPAPPPSEVETGQDSSTER